VIHLKGRKELFLGLVKLPFCLILQPQLDVRLGVVAVKAQRSLQQFAGMLAIELGETHVVFPAIGHKANG